MYIIKPWSLQGMLFLFRSISFQSYQYKDTLRCNKKRKKIMSYEKAEYRSLCEQTDFLRQIPLLVLLQNQWILHSSVNHQQLSSCQS